MEGMSNIPQKAEEGTSVSMKGSLEIETHVDNMQSERLCYLQ